MRMHFRPFATALVAVLALVITACGATELAEPDPAAASSDGAENGAVDETPATHPDGDDGLPTAPDPEADCSAQGAIIDPKPVDGMPAEVAATRDLLLDAALRCDEQLLFTATEESASFTFSFGNSDDPIGYWWDLEAAGDQPFLRLAQVLGTTPSTIEDGQLWTWPQVHTGRAEDTTDETWDELTWLEDPAATRAAPDGYLDWRVGISADGQWRFFVAGD